MPRHTSHHGPSITMAPTSPLLPPQPCKRLPGISIFTPEQRLGCGQTYQDVDQDQLRWVSALLVEHLLHAGLRGIRLKPTAVAVQAVMNLWETYGDLSGDRHLGQGGPVVNFSCSEKNKKFLRILSRREMEKLCTWVRERGREAFRS